MTSNKDLSPDSQRKARALALLADETLKERLVIFIGAGCSVTAGLPSWRSLIEELQSQANVKSHESNLFFRLTKLEKKWGRQKLRENIADRLRVAPKIKSSIHDHLIALDLNLYITTNYDHLLENMFRDHGYDPIVFSDPKNIPSIDATRKTIVKLHGDIDSPSSLVLTRTDYRKYSSDKKGFVEWLNNVLTQNTLLFLGTSFEDPRLLESDDYVLELYETSRRSPFILLKRPQLEDYKTKENYLIKLDDFEDKCQEFIDRGFYVVPIDSYDELPEFLQQLKEETTRLRLKQRETVMAWPDTNIATKLERYERKFGEYINQEIKHLCEEILGHGRIPTFGVIRQRAAKLLDFIVNNDDELTSSDRLEAYLTLTDAYCISNEQQYMKQARHYFTEAMVAYRENNKQANWQERVLRAEAKLLFLEGEPDSAIQKLSESTDPKTIGFRLGLQLDSGNVDDALNFVKDQEEFHPAWACHAISLLIYKGRVNEAEKQYNQIIERYEKAKSKGELKDTDFKGDYFYDKIHVFIANAFWQSTLRSTGFNRKSITVIYPNQLSEEARNYCLKSLNYIDLLWKQASRNDSAESYLISLALSIDMHAAYYLGHYERADAAAVILINARPIRSDVCEFITRRSGHFDKEVMEFLKTALIEDYPEQVWALVAVAQILWQFFNNHEEAWTLLSEAITLAMTSVDQKAVAFATLKYGLETAQLNKIYYLSRKLLDQEKDLQPIFDSIYEAYINRPEKNDPQEKIKRDRQEKAIGFLAEHEDTITDPQLQELKTLCKLIRAQYALKNGNFSKAKELALAANSVSPNSFSMGLLLEISVKEQNDFEIYKAVQELETYGLVKEPELHLKAQAAFYLGRIEEARKIYQQLLQKDYNQPVYALELAKIDYQQGKPAENIVDVLGPYIKGKGESDLNCLLLACNAYESEQKFVTAFSLLEDNFNQFQDLPEFLAKYIDLGFRAGKEDEVNKAFIQIERLRKAGKKVDHVFTLKHIDELKEWIRQGHEETKKFYEKYLSGRFPRLLLCDRFNRSLYLDWAIRTQPLSLSPDPQEWTDFTLYATNSLRVGIKNGRNQLIPISVPEKVDEIIIDYHAIITLHRLNLVGVLVKRFKTIYFPSSLLLLLKKDQGQFSHHQKSKEETYKKIHRLISQSRIDVWEAPPEAKYSADSLLKRNMRLANAKEAGYLDAFVKKEEIEDLEATSIIRLGQIIDWLYATGCIGENRRRKLKGEGDSKGYFLGEPALLEEYRSFLEPGKRLLVEQYTLELLDHYQLIELLIDRGIKLLVEKVSADEIIFKNNNIQFIKSVGNWHNEIANILRDQSQFTPLSPQKSIPPEVKATVDSLEKTVWFESVEIAEEKGLCLLTDDRFTQMLGLGGRNDRQFGTDVLLRDLVIKEYLDPTKYADIFLQLCKWRYRFLLPEVSILHHFAIEYQKHPPGEALQLIAKYGRDCLRDIGLFLGLEATDPPLPLGVKLYMAWHERWFGFLIAVWLDQSFSKDSLKRLTRFVLTMALPDPPHGLRQDIRDNMISEQRKAIMLHLLVPATQTDQPEKLHGLFEEIFRFYDFNKEQKLLALRYILNWTIKETEQNKFKSIRKSLIGRIIRAYYGKMESYEVEPVLHDLYVHAGIISEGEKKFEDNFESKIDSENIPEGIRNLLNLERALPNYEAHGVLMWVPHHEEKKIEVLVPHDLVLADSALIRMEAFKAILASEYVTDPSKKFIKKKELAISDGKASIWRPAASETSGILLKDFAYACSLFQEAWALQTPQHSWMDMAWNGLLHPNLDTVLAEAPEYVQPLRLKNTGVEGVQNKLIQETSAKAGKNIPMAHRLLKSLDWYLENLGFIPLGPPFDPWKVIGGIFLEKDNALADEAEEFYSILPRTISEWLDKNKEDYLAYVIGMQTILKARYEVNKRKGGLGRAEYEDKNFHKLLERIFDVLLKGEARIKGKSRSELLEICQAAWRLRIMIAQYYLRYIDLEIRAEWPEMQKILISWWMAHKITTILLEYTKPLTNSEQIKWLNEDAVKNVEPVATEKAHNHSLFYPIAPQGTSRFTTFTGKDLPARSALAVLQPPINTIVPFGDCVKGLQLPTRILSQDTTDVLLEHLTLELPFSYGQVQILHQSEDVYPLWDVPLTVSIPAVLNEYYGEKIKYLGKNNLALISFAEYNTEADFIVKELPLLSKHLKEKHSNILIVNILSTLSVHLLTQGKLHDSADELTKLDSLVEDLTKNLEPGFATLSLNIAINFLHGLLLLDVHHDISHFLAKQLIHVNFSPILDEDLQIAVQGLLSAVLFGADFELVKHVKRVGEQHKKIQAYINDYYNNLYGIIPTLPSRYRENARLLIEEIRIFSETSK